MSVRLLLNNNNCNPYVSGLHKSGSTSPRATSARGNTVQFADGSQIQVQTVIWATGYEPDFSWIAIPGALDESHHPIQHQGVSPIPGLFFLGLLWQRSRGSALAGWGGKDAGRLETRLAAKDHGFVSKSRN
jgi:putative flavoprotein involved in K+ transport